MKEFYELKVAGLTRQLPVCPISDELCIAGFVILGDIELTCACAKQLLEKAPEYDIMITAETKGIPLVHEMSRQAGNPKCIIARKSKKLYMKDPAEITVKSISTSAVQTLYISRDEVEMMHGKRILIVDDVISTGGSLRSLESLVEDAGGVIAGRMAILAEGDAQAREDLIYLAPLPLLDKNGDVIK